MATEGRSLRLITGDGESAMGNRMPELQPQRVRLATIAVLQSLASAERLPRHRNYLLTTYDKNGSFIPAALNQRGAPWDEEFATAESLRASLFPKTDTPAGTDAGLDSEHLESWATSFQTKRTEPETLGQLRMLTDALLSQYLRPDS